MASAQPTTDTTPDLPAMEASSKAYDRDLLRAQIDLLRREAAIRSRLEQEILAEHETQRRAVTAEAEKDLAATRQKYAREI